MERSLQWQNRSEHWMKKVCKKFIMAKKKFDIDQGFHQLDEILTKLSSEEIKLPEAVKLYTEGVNLVKQCKNSLDKVEKELIVLEENGEEHEL